MPPIFWSGNMNHSISLCRLIVIYLRPSVSGHILCDSSHYASDSYGQNQYISKVYIYIYVCMYICIYVYNHHYVDWPGLIEHINDCEI